ncbi:MAG: carboxypeptidase regulatory-like domain-containing protein [Candidatus Electryonea clarkiae]|nr:carboxypeptidase regulatory-like domain-containing protein [Candidatus Electryonea clarkiae]MDP8289190.1 carboxypeptidase regulatory-like domain-containing protein [Candidatus Electryonea clarkiae]
MENLSRILIVAFVSGLFLPGILMAEQLIDTRTAVVVQSELDEIIISEDFEDGLPDDWDVSDQGGEGTWFVETAEEIGNLEADYMHITVTNPIEPVQVDYLTMPSINCAGYSDVTLSFDYYIDIFMSETGRVEISIDGGDDFDNVTTFSTTGGEYPETLDLSEWADGEEDVIIRFHYNNQGGIWANDWGIDNVEIEATFSAGSISGIVTDAETTDPVEEAEVILALAETGEDIDTVLSDENGEFSFDAVSEGTYDIVASAEGYAPDHETDIEVVAGEEAVVELALHPLTEATIEQIQTEIDLDSWVTTTGIVTQPTNSTTTELTDFYIQDTTGFGVRIYNVEPWDPENNLERGDEVRLSGMIVEIDGVTEIIDFFDVEVLSVENLIPEKAFRSTDEMANNQEMEGSWVRINAALVDDPEPEGSYEIAMDDGSGEVIVYIFENTGIDLTEYSSGDWINVDGVIFLFEDNVRIVPSMTEDIYLTPMYPATDLAGELVDSLNGIVELQWEHNGNNEVDGFIEFILYRNEEEIAQTMEPTYSDTLPLPYEDGRYTFDYLVTALYDEGESESAGPVTIEWNVNPVTESGLQEMPSSWAIKAIYPNPFNPTVHTIVAVPQAAFIRAEVFNLLGQSVEVLRNGNIDHGYHSITWSADYQPAGLYLLRISSDTGYNATCKLLYIK